MSVQLSTVHRWVKDVDSLQEWLRYEAEEEKVVGIWCALCAKHREKLRGLRNFNTAFVQGISGPALKKDSINKHKNSDMHKKACRLEVSPTLTLTQIYSSTPLGKALSTASTEETERLSKLFDIAYVIAKQEVAFAKYPALVELEQRHAVTVGSTYATEHKCREFTMLIGETFKEKLLDALRSCSYFALLMDGSTDSSVKEKELIYVLYVDDDGKRQCHLFYIKDVPDATAPGMKVLLENTFSECGMQDWKSKLVSICLDGAAVNLGIRCGLATLLREEVQWLVSIYCLNHRLELATKNAFSITYMDDVSCMLMDLYYVHEKSPKRLRELRELGDIMDEHVRKPERAHGTRWLQHKSKAISSLIIGFPVLCAHLESMASEESNVKPADKARFKNYLKKLTSYKFVLHMLFFNSLLNPLDALLCHLQGSSSDLPFVLANLEAFYVSIENLRTDDPSKPSELSKFVESTKNADNPCFHDVNTSNTKQEILATFNNSRPIYIDKLRACVVGRFDDLDNGCFKAVRLLDTKLWPTDRDALSIYGISDISTTIDHFNTILTQNNVSLDGIVADWNSFKIYWLDTLQSMDQDQVWPLLMCHHKDKFPNLAHFINILMLFPTSNAKVERGFSAMRRIKTDWRSTLGEDTLDAFMRISIDGPPLLHFNSTAAVRRFLSTPRRTTVQPYGSRK